MHIIFLAAFLMFSDSVNASDHWKYPDLEIGEDFPHWGGTCDNGRRQSPINLSNKGALQGEYDKLIFKNYDKELSDIIMVNNGHTLQLRGFSADMQVTGGPLRSIYIVEQLHFHWWSEHTIDDIRFPLEVHIVHRNKRYNNMSAAVSQKDGIAVIGVLFHASNRENEAISNILENLDKVKNFNQIDRPAKLNAKDFSIDDLFPHITGYMTYPGSLTTPSCAESVTWIVLTETFPVQMQQVNFFKEIEFDVGKIIKSNYRNIQNNNHRELIVVFQDGYSNLSSDSLRKWGSPLNTNMLAFLFYIVFHLQ